MKNIIILFLCSIICLSSYSQNSSEVTSNNNFLDNFTLSADINLIEAMHLDGIADITENDISNLSSFVLKLKRDFILSNKLNFNASLGYSFGFEYIPIELGISYEIIDNLSANFGSGLFSISDDQWLTSGLNGEEPSDNEFGFFFGVDYMISEKIGVQINYNSIESAEDIEIASMSLTSLSFGVSYKL